MILKVLHIECKNLKRNNKTVSDIDSRLISEKPFYSNKFYVYKMFVRSSAESLGVLKDAGELAPLEDVMREGNMKLLKCRFVIIDLKQKIVYYDGLLDDIKDILQDFYDIKPQQILVSVSIDELETMKKLKIRTVRNGQMSAVDIDDKYDQKNEVIEDLCLNDGTIESSTYEIILKGKGSIFNRDKLKEIIEDHKSGLRTITAEGYDKDGRQVKLSSHIVKKVEILHNETGWQSRLNMPLQTVLDALRKEVNK
ncbi:MAG: hypothetical protein FD179_998 [Erysipelotrichaceae bacterium]|nr:MAG: hypothetical protein FD179_998 [Erysipelotrichaceae bacterium]